MLERKTKCSECCYCKLHGKADSRFALAGHKSHGRGYFYCENPEAQNMTDDHGNPRDAFIGYGTAEYETKLQLKTRPRWCPLEMKNEDLDQKVRKKNI